MEKWVHTGNTEEGLKLRNTLIGDRIRTSTASSEGAGARYE
jgi:hypothetical protein